MVFSENAEAQEGEFEYDDEEEQINEVESSQSSYCPSQENRSKIEISFQQKVDAVNFWNSRKRINPRTGKPFKLGLESVKKNLRFIHSENQLRNYQK